MYTKYLKGLAITQIITIILIISSCSDTTGTSDTLPYYTISEEFNDYCWFDSSSYWVFQNDSTLFTDTIKIMDIDDTKRFHDEQGGFNYQAVELFTKSNAFNISEYELTAGNSEPNPGSMNSLLRLYKNDSSYQLVFLPQYPLGEEIIMGEEIGVYTNIEFFESLWLNDKTYHDVYHTNVVISSKNTVYNYWIAKNHGIIKTNSTIDDQTISISLISDQLYQN